MCVYVHMGAGTYVHVCVETKDNLSFSSDGSTSRQTGSLTGLELTKQAQLAGQRAP